MKVLRPILARRAFITASLIVLAIFSSDYCGAHPESDAQQFGATMSVKAGSAIAAVLYLKPTAFFLNVRVSSGSESIGGARVICDLGSLTVGQRYECVISGDVPATNPALIVNVVGEVVGSDHGSHLLMKSFAVSNPNYDREAAVSAQKAISKKQAVSLLGRERPELIR